MIGDILIIDDETDIRTLIADILQDEGLSTREAASADEGMQQLTFRVPSLVLLDVWLGYVDGLTLLKKIQETQPQLPVIVMSGHGTFEMAVSAIKQGASDFIEKPFQVDRLLLSITRALETKALRQENTQLKRDVTSILWGHSPLMQNLKNLVSKLSQTNSRVLITGESGTGKELIARHVHQTSKRAQGPFHVLPCAVLKPETFDAEIFGVEDAQGVQYVGLFEQAHGGTLLLDTVSEMPFLTQGKLVRTLQEQTFKRVGGQQSVPIDVRIIASTTTPLLTAIQQKTFREDLYYRLNVTSLDLPPLRSFQEDVPAFLDHFLTQMCTTLGMPRRTWHESAVTALQSYPWPGNIRELKNITERALIMAIDQKTTDLTVDVLPPEVLGGLPDTVQSEHSEILTLPLKQARGFFEKQYLLAQMARFGGNISRTAKFVGMERSALHRKLRTLQVESKRQKNVS